MAFVQNIDIGIAMCHFELSAIEVGINGKWEIISPNKEYKDMTYVESWVGKSKE